MNALSVFTLTRIWQGKAVVAAVMIPSILAVILRIQAPGDVTRRKKREQNRHRYLAATEREAIRESLYPQIICGDEDILTDNMKDPTERTEDSVLEKITEEKLRAAVTALPYSERILIKEMFLKDRPMSMSEFCEKTGKDRAQIRRLREEAFRKLREMIG